jgi:hypothetical protein
VINAYPADFPTPTLTDFYCGACTAPEESKNYYAILDSGANDNFLLPTADVAEKETNHKPYIFN